MAGYLQVDNSKSVSDTELRAHLARRNQTGNDSVESGRNPGIDRIQIDIDEQVSIDVKVHPEKTVWHKCPCKSRFCCPKKRADAIQTGAQSWWGVTIGVVLVFVYMVSLYTYDRGDFGMISVYYSIGLLFITVPGSIIYFGTINAAICWAIMKKWSFLFKMSNVIICNIMSVIWAYHNVNFDIISPKYWFTIYAFYFIVNVITSGMGALLDGFKWNWWLRVLGPFLLFGYFLNSTIYWHYRSHAKTKIDFHVSSYEQGYLISNIAASSAANAAAFYFQQAVCAAFWPKQATVLEAQVTIKWVPPE